MNEIPTKNPFKIPENYLEDFHVTLPGTKGVHSEFNVPQGYLENFRVAFPETKKKQPKVIRLFNHYKVAAIAAAITLLIAVPLMVNTNRSNSIDLDQLSFSEVDSYLLTTQNRFDNYELADKLPTGTTELDFLASNDTNLEAYIDLQIEDYSELNLYNDDY